MKTNTTRKNFIWYYLYQFVLLISPLITTPYLSYTLGSENIGVFSFTFSIANYLYVFAQLGTQSYGVREIVRSRDDRLNMSKVFIEIEIMTVFTSIVCIIAFYIFIFFQTRYIFYYILWTIFILSATFDISWFYAGIEHFEEIFFRNIFFRLLGVICIFVFIKDVNDLTLYIIIYALTYLLSNLCMWTSIGKYASFIAPSINGIINHLKGSFTYFIPALAASSYVILDKSILGFIIEDKRENGYYEMANHIITFGKSISSIVITRIFEPKATYFYKNNQIDNIKKSISTSLDFTMFISIGIIFGIFAVARDFVPVFFGPDFLPVELLLKIMSPLIFITSITFVLEYEYLMPAGKRKTINYYVIIGAVVNIILNIIFIKYFKSIGAAITSIVAEIIVLVLFYTQSDGTMPIKTLFKSIIYKVLAGFIMVIVIYTVRYGFLYIGLNNPILMLILEVLIGGIAYILALYIFKDNIRYFKKNIDSL